MNSSIETTNKTIKQSGIIAILRGDFTVADMLRIGDALLAGTVNIMEVTLNSPFALQALPQLRTHFGDQMLVGAGTVRDASLAHQAVDAGAQFMVAPNFDIETVTFAQSRDMLHLPGICTATEVQTAFLAGCRMLKLFPMVGESGPAYLKALRGPFHDVDFVPTGGISLENIAEYAKAGAVAVGLGSKLVLDRQQPSADLTSRAVAARKAWQDAKNV